MTIEQQAHDLTMLYLSKRNDLTLTPVAYANEYKRIYSQMLETLRR